MGLKLEKAKRVVGTRAKRQRGGGLLKGWVKVVWQNDVAYVLNAFDDEVSGVCAAETPTST